MKKTSRVVNKSSRKRKANSVKPSNSGQPSCPFNQRDIEQGIHERFESVVRVMPTKFAIKSPDVEWSYAYLNEIANQIAYAILSYDKGQGHQPLVRPDGPALPEAKVLEEEQRDSGLLSADPIPERVGLLLPNGPQMLAAILGVLKAGKAYVPLDPNFPHERLHHIAADAGVSLLITDSEHLSIADYIAQTVLSLFSRHEPLLNLSEIGFSDVSVYENVIAPNPKHRGMSETYPNPNIRVFPSQVAYILYTSGATGEPKGIAFSHRNLLHTTMCLVNALHISPTDRLTQLHSTSFSASVVDIYCSLLEQVSTRGMSNNAALWAWPIGSVAKRITSLQWIPTPFRYFVEALTLDETFPDLRQIVMASEPLTAKEIALYRSHFSRDCLLINQIGTSESYNYGLYFIDHETRFEGGVVPAGYPVSPEREILILNEEGKPCEPGDEGEIAIRSAYMSLGYWQDRASTQAKFLPSPDGSELWTYLTGDIGYLRPDGSLIHLGRQDSQVEIRGYRVETSEIERHLCQLYQVKEAIVHAQPAGNGELQLVAYLIIAPGQHVSLALIRDSLGLHLPDYMIPVGFCAIDELPTTDTGKLDYGALPFVSIQRNSSIVSSSMPGTETQNTLAQIWQETFSRESIGIHDNLFDAGAQSLTVARFLQQANRQLGAELPFTYLMQNPTIAALGDWYEQNSSQPETQTKYELMAVASPNSPSDDEKQIANTETAIPDGLWLGIINRIFQLIALYAPGRKSLRIWLHRRRGVSIGNNVAIGTAALIETSYPRLVSIGHNSSIGIRSVIIAHFVDGLGATPKRKEAGGFSHFQAADASEGRSVVIEDDVFIGPMVTILPNVTIGKGAVVAAGSVVNQSVPSQTMVQGNPAVPVARCLIPLNGEYTYDQFLANLEFLEESRR